MVQLTLYVWFRQWLSNRLVTSHYVNRWRQDLSLYGVTRPQWVNSSWPSDAKWQHRSGSTLAQVMAHFLMVPRHYYLNQCSLIISEVLWPSTEGNSVTGNTQDIYPWCEFKNQWFKITAPSPMCQWFKVLLTCRSREAVQSWCLEAPCCEQTIWTISIIHHYGV